MKVSPAQLLFGNALDLDRGIFYEHNLPTESLTFSTAKVLNIQENLTRIARELLIQTDAEHNASVADILTQFDIGSYVLAAPRTTPATRMHTQWTGPYKDIAVQKGQYKLLDTSQANIRCITLHN